MSQRTETLTLGPFEAPVGTVVTAYVATFSEAGGTHQGMTVPANTLTIVAELTPGSWSFSAQAIDANGVNVGPASLPELFTIAAPTTVTVQIPVSSTGS